jgi:hypothetical protein
MTHPVYRIPAGQGQDLSSEKMGNEPYFFPKYFAAA